MSSHKWIIILIYTKDCSDTEGYKNRLNKFCQNTQAYRNQNKICQS